MKTLKHIIIMVVIISFCYASPAFAVLQVRFPSNSDMQPPPLNVKPNVSRNINYEGGRVSTGNDDRIENVLPRPDENGQQKTSNNDIPLVIGFLSMGLLVVALLAKEKKTV